MFYSIRFGFNSYDLKERLEPGDEDWVRRFGDWREANGLLLGCLSDSIAMGTLRDVLSKGGTGRPLWDMDDHEVIEAVARLLADRRMYLVEHKPFDYDGAFLLPEIKKEEDEQEEEKEEELTWIEFQVMGADGKPASGVVVDITLANGRVIPRKRTNVDGLVRLDDVEAGDCSITLAKLDEEAFSEK